MVRSFLGFLLVTSFAVLSVVSSPLRADSKDGNLSATIAQWMKVRQILFHAPYGIRVLGSNLYEVRSKKRFDGVMNFRVGAWYGEKDGENGYFFSESEKRDDVIFVPVPRTTRLLTSPKGWRGIALRFTSAKGKTLYLLHYVDDDDGPAQINVFDNSQYGYYADKFRSGGFGEWIDARVERATSSEFKEALKRTILEHLEQIEYRADLSRNGNAIVGLILASTMSDKNFLTPHNLFVAAQYDARHRKFLHDAKTDLERRKADLVQRRLSDYQKALASVEPLVRSDSELTDKLNDVLADFE